MKQLLAGGQEWLKTHQFNWEWLTADQAVILKHLQHTPLQVVIPGHAVQGFYEVADATHYFDSYDPLIKNSWRGSLSDVLKPLLTITNIPQNQTKVVLGKDGKAVFISAPCSKMEVLKERASVEGFELPAQIPPATTL